MEVIVVGAGVVGLACAASLSRRRHSVTVIEKNRRVGQEVSARNSEVIHAGLYDPPGSLKARLCVAGRLALYERAAKFAIPHRRCGKLVVASDASEVQQLEALLHRARQNGVTGVEIVDADTLRKWERRVAGVAALWSPETGIVDAHRLVKSFQIEAEQNGAIVALATEVVGLLQHGDLWQVRTRSLDGEDFTLDAEWVINAAGLSSDRVAEKAGLDVDALGYRLHPCKGDYFAIEPSLGKLATHLIYPVPETHGLGVHLTMDLGGRLRLGPDTELVTEPRYDIDPAKADKFAHLAGRYLPEVKPEHLSADFAGVRPKLEAQGDSFRDFVIEEASPHGSRRLINLIGIESPGLTASAAIGEYVAALLP